MTNAPGTYRVYALKYADRAGVRKDHFLGGDPDGDSPMSLSYYTWLITEEQQRRSWVLDTGFSEQTASLTALQRSRTYHRRPSEGLRLLGVDPAAIEGVILSHLHYDHAGTVDDYPNARIHLQERELSYATGRQMLIDDVRHVFAVDDVARVVHALYDSRVNLLDGDVELAPGLSLHLLGGHTGGNQVVRVHTARGWVVLASDASHFYENIETDRPFAIAYEPERVLAGYRRMYELADSRAHVIPGHDPLVMERYPAPSPDLEGIVVRLDVPPTA